MSRDAASALQRGAEHRVANIRRGIDNRHHLLDLRRREYFRVNSVQPNRVHPSRQLAQVLKVVREIEDAPLAQHDVEVELPAEALVELQRVIVEMRALVPEIVRANDRGVASGVAAAQPALLEHRHVSDAVQRRQIVCGRESVAPAADDDDVIRLPRLRAAPRGGPALVVRERVAGEGENRISHRQRDPRRSASGGAVKDTGAGMLGGSTGTGFGTR